MLGEFVRRAGFKIGGILLQSDYFAWILIIMRKAGIVRFIHALCDYVEKHNPTDEMLQYRKIGEICQKELNTVRNNLADQESKQVYDDIFQYRCTKARKYLRGHVDKNIYFNKLTLSEQRNDKEVLIDGGAFNGDTIKTFMKIVGKEFKHIFAFETEKGNVNKLKAFISKNNLEQMITIYPYALWSEKTTLYVNEEKGMNQRVVTEGEKRISSDKIDHLLKDEEITFIKMDIEGAELEALYGAQETIKRYKPKLAISIYHNPDDFYRIPLYIMSLVPEYQLYIRHHSCFFADTVLYAVYSHEQ